MEPDVIKYTGTIPKPTKKQIEEADIKDFEMEELSKHADEGLPGTVAEIIAEPEKYENVIKNPLFKQLLDAAGLTVKEVGESKDGKQAEKEADAAPKKEPGALEVSSKPVMPDDVVNIDSVTEDPAPKAETTKVNIFEPGEVIKTRRVSTNIEVHKVAGFVTLKDHGLGELLECPFDVSTTWGRIFRKVLMQYHGAGTIQCISYKDGTADSSLHGFVVSEELAPISGTHHKNMLSERRVGSHTVNANDSMLLRRLKQGVMMASDVTTFSGAAEADDYPGVLDLARVPRPVGSRVLAQDVYLNPEYVHLLLHSVKFHENAYLPYDRWILVHQRGGIISPLAVRYLQFERRQFEQREEISVQRHSEALYPLLFIGNSDTFYFTKHKDEPYSVCRDALQRSYNIGVEALEHIAAADSVFRSVDKIGAEWLGKLSAVTAGDAAEFARKLGAGMLGGYRRSIEIDLPADGMPELEKSACAFATLLLIDFSMLSPRARMMLLSACLEPFYHQCGHDMLVGQGRIAVPRMMRGYDEVVTNFLAAYEANPTAKFALNDPPPKYTNTMSHGARAGINIANLIATNINMAIQRKFHPMAIQNRLFTSKSGPLLFPFAQRRDVYDLVMHGEPNPADPPRYTTAAHVREAEMCAQAMNSWASTLENMPGGRGIASAMRASMQGKHIQHGMAHLSTAMVIGSQNRDLFPFRTGTAMIGGVNTNIIEKAVDFIELNIRGALGFLMHGVTSSKVSSNGHYLEYKDHVDPKMPSRYPLYVGLERAMFYDIVEKIRIIDADLLYVRRDETIELILKCLSRYFTLDPSSKDRIATLLEYVDEGRTIPGFPNENAAPGAVPPVVLPPYYKLNSATQRRRAGGAPPAYNNAPGLARGAIAANIGTPPTNEAFEAATEGPAIALDDAQRGVVKEFYIYRKPLEPMHCIQADKSSAFIYTRPAPGAHAAIIPLETLLHHRTDARTSWTVSELQAMATVYMADTAGGSEWIAIHIRNVNAEFEFVEDKGISDQLKIQSITVSIKRDPDRHRMNKFAVTGKIPVYVHQAGDRTLGRGFSLIEEARIMRSLMTYILVPWRTVRRSLMHFDGVNLDDTQLYTHTLRGIGVEYADKSEVSRVALRDGLHGITTAARIRLTTRVEETYTLMNTLQKRTLRGTI